MLVIALPRLIVVTDEARTMTAAYRRYLKPSGRSGVGPRSYQTTIWTMVPSGQTRLLLMIHTAGTYCILGNRLAGCNVGRRARGRRPVRHGHRGTCPIGSSPVSPGGTPAEQWPGARFMMIWGLA